MRAVTSIDILNKLDVIIDLYTDSEKPLHYIELDRFEWDSFIDIVYNVVSVDNIKTEREWLPYAMMYSNLPVIKSVIYRGVNIVKEKQTKGEQANAT